MLALQGPGLAGFESKRSHHFSISGETKSTEITVRKAGSFETPIARSNLSVRFNLANSRRARHGLLSGLRDRDHKRARLLSVRCDKNVRYFDGRNFFNRATNSDAAAHTIHGEPDRQSRL
jgi:hypothetical protein